MTGLGGFTLPATQKRQTLSSSVSIASPGEITEYQIQQAKYELVAALTDYYKQAIGGTSTALEVPTTYSQQVAKSREIWGGKYSDPFVSRVMDMVVQGCVDFGSENLLQTDDPESPMQKVLDHYCANVNSGMPTITKGLDAARTAFHRQRFMCGGVVPAWSDPEATMKTREGITYHAPLKIAMFPRDRFKPIAKENGEFGGMTLVNRDDLQEHQDTQVRQDDTKVELDGFLAAKRYQVSDRGRDETTEHYPVPYLATGGLFGICEEIRAHKQGDYSTSKRIIRALLIITRGSEKWVELTGEIPELKQFESLLNAFIDKEGGFVNALAGDYTMKANWTSPPLEGLLSSDKYTQLNMERLAGLGIIRIEGQGQRISYMYNPKPLLMEMFSAMQADRRFIEGIIYQILIDANPVLFKDSPVPNFRQKTPSLFLDQWEKEHIAEMFERGGLSWGTYGEQLIGFGFDASSEKRRREREKAEGYEEVFKPHVLFTQTVRDDDNGDSELKPIDQARLEAAKQVNFTKAYRDLREQVREAAKAEMGAEEKKRRIWSIVMASFAGMAFLLRQRLTEYYSDQFEDTIKQLGAFQPYIESQARGLEAFGQDLLEGKNGMTGLYAITSAAPGEVDDLVRKSFATHLHRLSLYEKEPFHVAMLSAQAAKAMDAGMKYAVRHSAFAKTTCQECIDLHGEIVPIAQVFAGTWEHPHGWCTLTFHESMAAAQKEKEEMLSISEINALVEKIDEMEDSIFATFQ